MIVITHVDQDDMGKSLVGYVLCVAPTRERAMEWIEELVGSLTESPKISSESHVPLAHWIEYNNEYCFGLKETVLI